MHQIVAPAGSPSEYFLCEEKLPLAKERSEVKRCAQQRPLAPEEEVNRLVNSWHCEEGCVGRISLRTREEVLLHALFSQGPQIIANNSILII